MKHHYKNPYLSGFSPYPDLALQGLAVRYYRD
jgi:hypothetical protein